MAKINLDFKFFFFLVGPQIGLNPLTRPAGSGGDGSGPRKKKNSLSKRVGFGPGFFIPGPNLQAKTHGPNSARLLSEFFFFPRPGPVPARPRRPR